MAFLYSLFVNILLFPQLVSINILCSFALYESLAFKIGTCQIFMGSNAEG